MQIGVIGLGRMGGNISRRLMQHGHEPVVYDHDAKAIAALTQRRRNRRRGPRQARGAIARAARGLGDAAGRQDHRRRHRPTRQAACRPATSCSTAAIRSGRTTSAAPKCCKERDIHHVDVGTSGGVWGLERGYCMMIGGPKEIVDRLDPIFKALAPGLGNVPRTPGRDGRDPRAEQGYIHAGPNGAGHFVKMVHNGIEYGLMQAFAEGFDILKNANSEALAGRVAFRSRSHRHRRSLAARQRHQFLAARSDGKRAGGRSQACRLFEGVVEDSGEGRWTIMAAIEEAVPADVLSAALYTRFRSRRDHTFAEKILSAMRKGFGAHVEPTDAQGQSRS